jgi:Protein of unknown function (DUF742)
MPAWDRWVGHEAGPVVRPYAVTGGRTEPAGGQVLDLVAVVVASGQASVAEPPELAPEHRGILSLCASPITVSDVASGTGLPLGVVRVLLADLIEQGWIRVLPQRPPGEQPSPELLREVLNGLNAL